MCGCVGLSDEEEALYQEAGEVGALDTPERETPPLVEKKNERIAEEDGLKVFVHHVQHPSRVYWEGVVRREALERSKKVGLKYKSPLVNSVPLVHYRVHRGTFNHAGPTSISWFTSNPLRRVGNREERQTEAKKSILAKKNGVLVGSFEL